MGRKALYLYAGIVLIAWVSGFSNAHADNFGAPAYSPATGAYGAPYDHRSRRRAERVALRICRRYSGGCQAALFFKNGCGALATASNGGWGTTRRIAYSDARRVCRNNGRNCKIRVCACTTR